MLDICRIVPGHIKKTGTIFKVENESDNILQFKKNNSNGRGGIKCPIFLNTFFSLRGKYDVK